MIFDLADFHKRGPRCEVRRVKSTCHVGETKQTEISRANINIEKDRGLAAETGA